MALRGSNPDVYVTGSDEIRIFYHLLTSQNRASLLGPSVEVHGLTISEVALGHVATEVHKVSSQTAVSGCVDKSEHCPFSRRVACVDQIIRLADVRLIPSELEHVFAHARRA